MSGLTSDRMRRLIAQAASAFDWVIVDTPPVGLLPDASLLSAFVDGVLLVVRAGKAPFALVKRTVEAITHDRILGVVMNAIDLAHDRNAGGYYEYYGAGYYGTPIDQVATMAKGLIQTAHWRSTTLIVSETALILGAVVGERAFPRRRTAVAAGRRRHAAQGAGDHLRLPAVPLLRRPLRRPARWRQPHRAVHPHAAGARDHAC